MHFPRQRRLSIDAKDKATQLLSLKANKKLVQQKLSQETGQVVLVKVAIHGSTLLHATCCMQQCCIVGIESFLLHAAENLVARKLTKV